MTNTDMVKITISKFGTDNHESDLFTEGFSMEFNVIQRILEAKEQYRNAIEAYFDGFYKGVKESLKSEEISVFERKRLAVMYRKNEAVHKHYQRILNNFSIESLDAVKYLGVTYGQNESVRRFTEVHIEELSEVEQISSIPVVSAKVQYVETLREFLQIVRFSPFVH